MTPAKPFCSEAGVVKKGSVIIQKADDIQSSSYELQMFSYISQHPFCLYFEMAYGRVVVIFA